MHLGLDEHGKDVYVWLAERNMLLGGEPGAGKSSGLNLITAHGALSRDCRLVLIDGKQVELGWWQHVAHAFVGPSITDAIAAMHALQADHERSLRQAARDRPPEDHPRLRRPVIWS